FFKQIGKCDFRAVEAKDENAAFKNYTLIGYPDYGLVVLENYENDNNATYIMTLEEFKSFVNVNENGTVTFKKSKSAVKEERDRDQGKTIQTPNHVKTWGKNVITAMKALSKDAEREISIEQHIKLSRDMMDDYCENRILTGKLTDEEKKRKLKENELDKAKTENDLLNYYKKRMRRKFREINERLKKEEGQ
ncbi:hypothetical protein ACQCP7_26185, partial [Ralstonia pseudosolanacearum]|uniref:hypothetical protein n=1 Tax=Ralstonia pseudosolanacearum TaxID=1310165 RepID=UPI003CF4D5D7